MFKSSSLFFPFVLMSLVAGSFSIRQRRFDFYVVFFFLLFPCDQQFIITLTRLGILCLNNYTHLAMAINYWEFLLWNRATKWPKSENFISINPENKAQFVFGGGFFCRRSFRWGILVIHSDLRWIVWYHVTSGKVGFFLEITIDLILTIFGLPLSSHSSFAHLINPHLSAYWPCYLSMNMLKIPLIYTNYRKTWQQSHVNKPKCLLLTRSSLIAKKDQ